VIPDARFRAGIKNKIGNGGWFADSPLH